MLDEDYAPVEASPDAMRPRYSVLVRASPNAIVESLLTHVSRDLPPASREPFLLSQAGLRTDQEGFGPNETELAEMGARGHATDAARSGLLDAD